MYAHVSLFVCLRDMWLTCSRQWGSTGRVKWNACVRKESWAHLKYYYGICQEVGLLRKPTKNLGKCSLILNIIRSLNCPGIQDRNITGRATLLCAHMHKDVRIFTHINWMKSEGPLQCSTYLAIDPEPMPKKKQQANFRLLSLICI
jgi:hypothetical protein